MKRAIALPQTRRKQFYPAGLSSIPDKIVSTGDNIPINTNVFFPGNWCQPVGVFEPGENFVLQTLTPTGFKPYSTIGT